MHSDLYDKRIDFGLRWFWFKGINGCYIISFGFPSLTLLLLTAEEAKCPELLIVTDHFGPDSHRARIAH